MCPVVYENADGRFTGDVHLGLLCGNRDNICKLMQFILVDSLNDVTCQGNE